MSEQDKQTAEKEGRDLYEWVQALVCSVLTVVLVFTFGIRLIGVDGHSMVPTLQDGDRLLVTTSLLSGDYEYGDIVIIQKGAFAGGEPIVKRVIATGGQTVDIDFDAGVVYVDGEALEESYVFEPTYRSFREVGDGLDYPVTVPEGSVFVLGDNRNHSADSRYAGLGCVDESRILGRVLLRIIPGRQTNEQGDIVGGRDFRRIGAVA